MKLSEIINALPKLKQKELLTLRAAIDQLAAPKDEQHSDLFYDATAKLLSTRMPYTAFTKTAAFKIWRKHVGGCEAFITETWPEAATKVLRMALISFMMEMLVDDLKRKKISVNFGTLANTLDTLPQVFEMQFPEYRESGLAHLILHQMKRRSKNPHG